MKVYGFYSSDIQRGHLRAALVDTAYWEKMGDVWVAVDLTWDYAFSSFNDAKEKLLADMKAEQVEDTKLYKTVRSLKASSIPIEQDIKE